MAIFFFLRTCLFDAFLLTMTTTVADHQDSVYLWGRYCYASKACDGGNINPSEGSYPTSSGGSDGCCGRLGSGSFCIIDDRSEQSGDSNPINCSNSSGSDPSGSDPV